MVIKTVQMGIPILISRSGFTAWGVDLARQAGLTLIGRAKGKRFVALAGSERIVFDGDARAVEDEHPRLARKASARKRTWREDSRLAARRRASLDVWVAATKALRILDGIPLLDRVIERLRPQVDALVLNANGDPARLPGYALPIVPDSVSGFAGPLAGVLAGLDWAASHRPDCPYIASVATDAPFLPTISSRSLPRGLDAADGDLACAALRRPRAPGVRPVAGAAAR